MLWSIDSRTIINSRTIMNYLWTLWELLTLLLGPVQTLNFSWAEPKACFKCRATAVLSIVFRVVSRTKNKYAKATRIHKSSFVLNKLYYTQFRPQHGTNCDLFWRRTSLSLPNPPKLVVDETPNSFEVRNKRWQAKHDS